MERLGEWSFRGYLPHFDAVSTRQLVTFRLCDALPKDVNAKLAEQAAYDSKTRKEIEKYLDRGHGEVLLRRRENAEYVKAALLHFQGARYRLHAWVVMPNHVHVLIEPFANFTIGQIVRSWKGFSSFKIGKLETRYLEKNGRIWQPDYFDRYIRDDDHYSAALRYIMENPAKAGLVTNASEWRWSSAYVGKQRA